MPIRTCLVTRKKAEPSAFFRFTAQNGKLVFDAEQKNPGRGGYVVKDKEALQKLSKLKKKLSYFLKSPITIEDEVIENQINILTHN